MPTVTTTQNIELPITGMTCAACAARIEKVLGKIPGTTATVNFATETATVALDPQRASATQIISAIEKAGYAVPAQLTVIKLDGMTCAACATRIEKALNALPSVTATVNFATEQARISHPPTISSDNLIEAVRKTGYGAQVMRDDQQGIDRIETERLWRQEWIVFAIAAALTAPFLIQMVAMLVSDGHEILPRWFQWLLATPVQFWAGKRFYLGAWKSLRGGSANMDVLIALGTSMAYFSSAVITLFSLNEHVYFEASAAIISLVLLGKLLEARAKRKTSAAIEALSKLQPKTARVLRGGQLSEIPIEDMKIDDIYVVRAGESVPVDGEVIEGESSVDESLLTGESMPVSKTASSQVYAGTGNQNGQLRCRATGIGHDTQLAAITRLVAQAQGSKAPIQRLADKISGVFVPIVVVISALTFVLTWGFSGELGTAMINAVAVLVIACPCALGLATPTAIMVGIGRGAQSGILIRNAAALEQAEHLKTIILDKTGTLTEGKPAVTEILPGDGMNADRLIYIASTLEQGSHHPLGKAILNKANELAITAGNLSEFEAHTGEGIAGNVDGEKYLLVSPDAAQRRNIDVPPTAAATIASLQTTGKTVVVLSNGRTSLGIIAIADKLRTTSISAVEQMKSQGLHVVMLTGDNPITAGTIAKEVNVSEFIAEVKPAGKAAEVDRRRNETGHVGMVGDGVNDAPALAAADVSFAMGGGSDIAAETADITLMSSDLHSVSDAIDLSRATLRKIRQNLFFAFIYNVLGIPAAALGFLNPVVAGAAMAMSSVSVLSNSLLLRRWRPPSKK